MGSIFSKPKAPPPPPAPEPLPGAVKGNEPEISEARRQSRRRQANLKGRRSTILTSPQGLPSLLHTGEKTSKALGA